MNNWKKLEQMINTVAKKFRRRDRRRCKKALAKLISLYQLAQLYVRLTREKPEVVLEGRAIHELSQWNWEEFPDEMFIASNLEQAWQEFHVFYHPSREEPYQGDIDCYEWDTGEAWRGNYIPLPENCYDVLEIPRGNGISNFFFLEKSKEFWNLVPA